MTLSEIEQQYGFAYPALYQQLAQDGMLDVGEYGPDWYQSVFPALKERPTLLLHADDFELLSINAVAEALAELNDIDDERQIDPAFKFIPFAKTGAGDHYCFFSSGQAADEMPVVLLWHDQDEVNYLAANLQDFIVRTLLDSMAEQDTYNDVSDEEFRDNLEKMLGTHLRYLTQQQSTVLQALLARDIIDYEVALPKERTETHRGLISDVELRALQGELSAPIKPDFACTTQA